MDDITDLQRYRNERDRQFLLNRLAVERRRAIARGIAAEMPVG